MRNDKRKMENELVHPVGGAIGEIVSLADHLKNTARTDSKFAVSTEFEIIFPDG